MNLPTLDINEIPDLTDNIGVMGDAADTAFSVGTGDLLIIVATYFLECTSTMSILK